MRGNRTLDRRWIVALIAGAGMTAAGCASTNTGARTGLVPRAARMTALDVRHDARLMAMLDVRRADSLLVDTLLIDGDPDRRARTALAIGQLRMRARFPHLRRLLTDGDTLIAANAAYALGVAKDTQAVAALARAIGGAPDPVAREAAWALGEIGEPSRTVLSVALGDGLAAPLRGSSASLRSAPVRAALVLATVKLRPAPITLVVPWLADTSAQVVRSASYVIGRLRAPAGVRALLAVRDHADDEVRQNVARALTRTTVGDSLAAPAREALNAFLRDADWRVRANAAGSVSTFGASALDGVQIGLADSVANVRVVATDSLSVVFGRDSARWRLAWERDTLLAVRRLMLAHVRRVALPIFDAEVATWEQRTDWRYRMAALEHRARTGDADRVLAAEAFSADADPRVRSAALQRVANILDGALATRVRLLAERASTDRDSVVRALGQRLLAPRDTAARVSRRVTPDSIVARPLAEYERLVRQWGAAGSRQPVAVIETDYGVVTLQLFVREAPLVVEAFVRLAKEGYYRNTVFHRVVPNFVVQDGDPRGDGTVGPGFSLRESFSRQRHERGCLGLATSGPDTGGSQYYLCHSSQPHLDGAYTVFGTVLSGFDVMDRIVQGDRMVRIRIQ
ncbi:peptidylprolyl isomerase [Gemmatimonas sp.]|uniref:peptidylprolyl isomerase n=1 Tax=Gemmatimonas sp. TaxID=1962908 RepID=UPI00286BF31E|nr:peptidylprolyl isomerase [Gemmatimonas sp.]